MPMNGLWFSSATWAAFAGLVATPVALESPPASTLAQPASTTFRFQFSPGKAIPGYVQVAPSAAFTKELGYGFDLGSIVTAINRGGDDALRGGFVTSDKPIYFSVDLPAANFKGPPK